VDLPAQVAQTVCMYDKCAFCCTCSCSCKVYELSHAVLLLGSTGHLYMTSWRAGDGLKEQLEGLRAKHAAAQKSWTDQVQELEQRLATATAEFDGATSKQGVPLPCAPNIALLPSLSASRQRPVR
jgi:hypothetical protein